jgi:hypothetical protein
MRLDLLGFKLICCWEAYVSVSYPDGFLDKAKTIPRFSWGFGGLAPGDGAHCDLRQAFELVKKHTDDNNVTIGKWFGDGGITQHEWNACHSLFYQDGSLGLQTVGAAWRARDADWVDAFARCDRSKTTGQRLKGLTKRRHAEMLAAKHGDYGDIAQFKCFDGDPKIVPIRMMDWPDYLTDWFPHP